MFYVRSIGVIRTCVLEVQGKRSAEVKEREGGWGVSGRRVGEGKGRKGRGRERRANTSTHTNDKPWSSPT